MEPIPPEAEKQLGQDLESFEQLPVKTQELETLQDLAEKTSGVENAAVHKEIRKISKQDPSHPGKA
jgi:hypothetical protein